MNFLPDRVLHHLRQAADRPDLTATRYELQDEIGRGGIGVVYRARDTLLDRDVALKVLDAGDVPDAEAATLARLEHPGIVPVYDAGELPDGRRYYAMRLIRGRRLDEFIRHEPALPARLRVFLKVCDAVAFAHSQGILHRDLKPQNIMTGEFGQVFVLDWGLGGTPRYMPPESAETSRERYDIFSLGRVLEDIKKEEAAAPLAAIAARATAPEPAHRYPSVANLAADIVRYLDHQPVTAYQETLWERTARVTHRNQAILLLLAAYLIVKFALFFFRY